MLTFFRGVNFLVISKIFSLLYLWINYYTIGSINLDVDIFKRDLKKRQICQTIVVINCQRENGRGQKMCIICRHLIRKVANWFNKLKLFKDLPFSCFKQSKFSSIQIYFHYFRPLRYDSLVTFLVGFSHLSIVSNSTALGLTLMFILSKNVS